MKTGKLKPGIEVNGDEGVVCELPHNRTPYDVQ